MCSAVLAGGLVADTEEAEAGNWYEGVPQNLGVAPCNAAGSTIWVIPSASYVGYWIEPSATAPMPNVGGVSYIHAVVWNVSGCLNDTAGIEFFLPAGVTFANDAAEVFCFRGTDSNNFTRLIANCSQQGYTGNYGGRSFGWGTLAPGQFLEIQVPVRFHFQQTATITALAQTAFGVAIPSIQMQVPSPFLPPPPVEIKNYSATSNDNGTQVNASFELRHNYQAGQLYVDFGTTANLDQTTQPVTTSAQYSHYPNATLTLTGLTGGTTYYWRPRFVVNGRTTYGLTQRITTNVTIVPFNKPPTYCRWSGCP